MKKCIFILNNKKCKLGEKNCPGYQDCEKCFAIVNVDEDKEIEEVDIYR